MKEHLKLFLKEWKKFYPDQIKTYVEVIVYIKKVSKFEAMKTLEDEITEQFNSLVAAYHNFPDPFKIYSIWGITEESGFLQNHKGDEEISIVSSGGFTEFWTWDKDSYGLSINEYDTHEYKITGMVYQKEDIGP